MAHVEKFTQGSVNGLSIHIERKTTNHSNPDIDSERTYLNYDLCDKEGDMNQRLKNRLAEVYCFNRADVKVMADWIVTLPKSLEQETMSTQKEFFKSTVDFLNERYGNQNVLSATVHHDETTPHLHYAFIPVVFDEKKQREKVSAKEVLTRKELSSFHQDLDNYLKQQISHIYQEGILNNQTIGIDDVKIIKKMAKEIAEKETELSQRKEHINKKIKEVKNIDVSTKNVYAVQDQWNHLTNQFEKTLFGKTIVDTKNLANLKEFMGGVQKEAELTKTTNYNLNKKVKNLTEKIEKHTFQLEGRDNQINRLKQENRHLKQDLEETQEHTLQVRDNNRVLKSLLKDTGKTDFSMSQVEYEGRVILEKLENDEKPRDSYECSDWKETLEENRIKRYIPENRLTQWIQQLTTWLKQLITREKQIEQQKSREMSR
ncbi:MobV family relaxase [Enterococcus sp. HY326]|uniref:MobV family relaxase n=1 Tax=Enterococcus sp. HY326 TaxID=2971265 RepID=UPI00223F13D5|nr:MobV family relaxase [Enterococcus sp. HY326]